VSESLFELRKKDHIRCSLKDESQSSALKDWDRITLTPEALPEIDFAEVSLSIDSFGQQWATPFYVSSMTAGHSDSLSINAVLAESCEQKGWLLGVGSQRRELSDTHASNEWVKLRQRFPRINLASNIGITQVIQSTPSQIQKLVDSTEAKVLFVHLNPLQEVLQIEGTPQFRGGLNALKKLVGALAVPIVIKEVGVGISATTAKRLFESGIAAIDVSGRGGTHWGRVEGLRAPEQSFQAKAALTFKDWGLSTPQALFQLLGTENSNENIKSWGPGQEVWASGGIRDGLQAAKCLAMGAARIGLARPFLQRALVGVETVIEFMDQLEFELKVSLFCLGIKDIRQLKQRKVWLWEKE
jgi:isopentenyl-diphosphate delta-isomerase